MITVAGANAEVWGRYWAAGHEHSCPTSFSGFYGPVLQAFWERQAAGLGRADVVLDLGCGPGALLRHLATRFTEGERPAMIGVDAATFDVVAMPGVTLHRGIAFSSLPVAPGSVSLAVSQFGFEYGDTPQAWAELLRVLRPQSRLAFVVHKRGSQLDRVAADDLTVARSALAHDGALAAARRLAPFLAQSQGEAGRASLSANREAETARAQFNAAVDSLVGLADLLKNGDYVHDILGAVSKRLADTQAGRASAIPRGVEAIARAVEDHVVRIQALRDSALDRAGMDALRRRWQAAGFTVPEPQVISEQGHEMGWAIEGHR